MTPEEIKKEKDKHKEEREKIRAEHKAKMTEVRAEVNKLIEKAKGVKKRP